ncbi:MAG: hypothetical protein EO766_12220 [Hydrotalea sp. AMD]|uniref:hypothetical protein n=1 Tax=Hydrotalea sp. AMD TaxID=2501297 RepID=UPI00102880CD|nr:hypothetical protein [Hydrotalea sp. AMD]RWZ87283.1 MAG: hypothetical protein EO766_12220 [Hydrotalea sp. AMD]
MIVSTGKFTYSKQSKCFVAEASDIESDVQPLFHQIYPDTCDIGITLISHRSETEVTYFLNETFRDRENEVQYWTLLPTPESERKVPTCRGTFVRIFND